jgi:multiple sugar transport system ATP-binding protein
MARLELIGLSKRYGDHAVVAGVTLDVADGEFLVLLGPSGCGKTTTLRIVAGFIEPTSGSVRLGDRDITGLPPWKRNTGVVFQSYALFPHMTVAENIAFGLEMRKVPKAQREEAVGRVAKMLQIERLLDRKPGQLSGGQRQRVAMGRALARDPKLFLFDEPLSNLDAKLRVEMRAEIKLLHHRTKTTTVYVTHDQVEAMTLGDRIAVMKDGVVQQFGTPDDIYARPATRFVAEFIGSPAMNMIAATRTDDSVSAMGVDLALDPAQQAALRRSLAKDLIYGLRPEALHFAEDGLPGTLRMTEPTGPETYAQVETAIGVLTLRVPGLLNATPGQNVHVRWTPEAAHLFDAATERRVG